MLTSQIGHVLPLCRILAVRTGAVLYICQRGHLQRKAHGALSAVQVSAHEVAVESLHGSDPVRLHSDLQIRGQEVAAVSLAASYYVCCHVCCCCYCSDYCSSSCDALAALATAAEVAEAGPGKSCACDVAPSPKPRIWSGLPACTQLVLSGFKLSASVSH